MAAHVDLARRASAERAARLAELADAHGRPAPKVVLLVGVHVAGDAARARREAGAHLRGQYGLPLEAVERWTPAGPAAAVAEQLQAHVDAGVEELVLMPLGGDPLTQYERLAEVRDRLARPASSPSVPVPGARP